MNLHEMEKYANQRGMSLTDYKKWLDLQIENFDFDSDEIPEDVAKHIANVYGLELAEAEAFLMEEEGGV